MDSSDEENTTALEVAALEQVSMYEQVCGLMQRLQCHLGWELNDLFAITVLYCLVAGLMLFESSMTKQKLLMTLAMTGMPLVVLGHKIVAYAKTWTDHRTELDDRLVSLLAFQMATSSFTFAVPCIAVFVATVPVYLILDWNLETYVVQALFCVGCMVVILQLGRTLAVYFRGDFETAIFTWSVVILISFLSSSLPVASWKMPGYIRWMIYTSVNFWSNSGAIMNHFDPAFYDNSKDCNDFASCLSTDGGFIVRYVGFAPYSNQFLAMGVLTGLVVSLVVLEAIFLRLCRS